MIKKSKRAQSVFGLSYGVIFSIIIIIFTVAVAFFAIRHFMGLNRCAQIGFFYDDLQQEVEQAWAIGAGRYEDNFEGNLPTSGLLSTGLEKVCFGNLSLEPNPTANDADIIKAKLVDFIGDSSGDENVFLYPPEEACDEMFAYTLKCRDGDSDCMKTSSDLFFCVNVTEGKAAVHLSKDIFGVLVKLSEPT